MIIVGLDVETTGTKVGSEVIELGWCVYATDENQPLAGGYEIFNPQKWSTGAEEVHEISRSMVMVANQKPEDLDLWGRIAKYQPQAVVAHNAEFDHRFIHHHWPQLCYLPWICTMSDLDHGLVIKHFRPWRYSKKIHLLAADYKIRYDYDDLHRAYADAIISCKIAAQHLPMQEPFGLRDLVVDRLLSCQEGAPKYVDMVVKGPYLPAFNTDVMTKYGFGFESDGDKKWHKIVKDPDNNEKHIRWMAENFPGEWLSWVQYEELCGPHCCMRKKAP